MDDTEDRNIADKKRVERLILNLVLSFEEQTGLRVHDIIWHENKPILDVAYSYEEVEK